MIIIIVVVPILALVIFIVVVVAIVIVAPLPPSSSSSASPSGSPCFWACLEGPPSTGFYWSFPQLRGPPSFSGEAPSTERSPGRLCPSRDSAIPSRPLPVPARRLVSGQNPRRRVWHRLDSLAQATPGGRTGVPAPRSSCSCSCCFCCYGRWRWWWWCCCWMAMLLLLLLDGEFVRIVRIALHCGPG